MSLVLKVYQGIREQKGVHGEVGPSGLPVAPCLTDFVDCLFLIQGLFVSFS